jgi:hypothetical protein
MVLVEEWVILWVETSAMLLAVVLVKEYQLLFDESLLQISFERKEPECVSMHLLIINKKRYNYSPLATAEYP